MRTCYRRKEKVCSSHGKRILPLIQMVCILVVLLHAISGKGVELGTRHKTILPCAVAPETPGVAPSNVAEYVTSAYGKWTWGPGTNEGQKLTLMPAGYAGATNAARLLSFFSLADVHITDKESPAQVPYLGWSAAFGDAGLAQLNPSAYTPVILATTHRLDAAVKTINELHRIIPFDFGIVLGDMCNSGQYNELRWFIDVMDGQYITPSSGAHDGADTIDEGSVGLVLTNPPFHEHRAMGDAVAWQMFSDAHRALQADGELWVCLLYTSPSPRDRTRSRMPSSA